MSQSEEVDDQLEVEKILEKKIVDGKPLYLLRWKGYASSEDTWEPPENLGCPELLKDFEKKETAKVRKISNKNLTAAEQVNALLGTSGDFPTQVPFEQTTSFVHAHDSYSHSAATQNNAAMSACSEEVNSNLNSVASSSAATPAAEFPFNLKTFLDSEDSGSTALQDNPSSSVDAAHLGIHSATASSRAAQQNEGALQQVHEPEPQSDLRGFERGCAAEKILGATDASGELMFLMKWKDCNKIDLVLAKEAKEKCPKVVIDFYVRHLTWTTSSVTAGGSNQI